jgi:hypothetical protein
VAKLNVAAAKLSTKASMNWPRSSLVARRTRALSYNVPSPSSRSSRRTRPRTLRNGLSRSCSQSRRSKSSALRMISSSRSAREPTESWQSGSSLPRATACSSTSRRRSPPHPHDETVEEVCELPDFCSGIDSSIPPLHRYAGFFFLSVISICHS